MLEQKCIDVISGFCDINANPLILNNKGIPITSPTTGLNVMYDALKKDMEEYTAFWYDVKALACDFGSTIPYVGRLFWGASAYFSVKGFMITVNDFRQNKVGLGEITRSFLNTVGGLHPSPYVSIQCIVFQAISDRPRR